MNCQTPIAPESRDIPDEDDGRDRPCGPTGARHREFPAADRTRLLEGYAALNRPLSILRALIFDSSVDPGTPSRVAAPNGPVTRPMLSLSAASMASFSWVASVPVERLTAGGLARDRPESHCASIESVSESHTITARSM